VPDEARVSQVGGSTAAGDDPQRRSWKRDNGSGGERLLAREKRRRGTGVLSPHLHPSLAKPTPAPDAHHDRALALVLSFCLRPDHHRHHRPPPPSAPPPLGHCQLLELLQLLRLLTRIGGEGASQMARALLLRRSRASGANPPRLSRSPPPPARSIQAALEGIGVIDPLRGAGRKPRPGALTRRR
jgi:hypothetical protein